MHSSSTHAHYSVRSHKILQVLKLSKDPVRNAANLTSSNGPRLFHIKYQERLSTLLVLSSAGLHFHVFLFTYIAPVVDIIRIWSHLISTTRVNFIYKKGYGVIFQHFRNLRDPKCGNVHILESCAKYFF